MTRTSAHLTTLVVAVFLSLCLLTSPGWAQESSETAVVKARAAFEEALAQFHEDRDAAAAREGMRRALAHAPTFVPALYDRGVFSAALEDWDDAIAAFDEVVRLEKDTRVGRRAASRAERCRRAAREDAKPGGREARRYRDAILRARSLARVGLLAEAVAEARVAEGIDASRPEAYGIAAGALVRGGDVEGAIELLRSAAGRVSGEHAAAIRDSLERCEAYRRAEALRVRAAAALDEGAFDRAAEAFESAWGGIDGDPNTGLAAATAYVSAGLPAKAAGILDELSRHPDPVVAAKATERARVVRAEARRDEPTNVRDLVNRGWSSLRSRDFAGAVDALTAAYELAPDDPDVLYAHAALATAQGKRDTAIDWLRACVDAAIAGLNRADRKALVRRISTNDWLEPLRKSQEYRTQLARLLAP